MKAQFLLSLSLLALQVNCDTAAAEPKIWRLSSELSAAELLAFKDPVPYYKEGTDSAKCMLTGDLPVTSEESVNQVPLFCQFDTAEES